MPPEWFVRQQRAKLFRLTKFRKGEFTLGSKKHHPVRDPRRWRLFVATAGFHATNDAGDVIAFIIVVFQELVGIRL